MLIRNREKPRIFEIGPELGVPGSFQIDFRLRPDSEGSPVFSKRRTWADRVLSISVGFILGALVVAVPIAPQMCAQQAHIRATEEALSALQKENWQLRDQSPLEIDARQFSGPR